MGLGYVGLTGAGCLLREGHSILGVEPNEFKINTLLAGRSPISEPGLEGLLAGGMKTGRLSVAREADHRLADCDIVFVCVGTPSLPNGSHDMTQVLDASEQLANVLARRDQPAPVTVVYRSTMRPGSVDSLIRPIFAASLDEVQVRIDLVYNPEFLRETSAVDDYFNPPKIVIGTEDGRPSPLLQELYRNISAPIFVTKIREAELVKFIDNAWHALKVTYANEIGRLCTGLGISAERMHQIFIADRKLNISPYYTRPGGAFGGPCLPKDLRALSVLSSELGTNNAVVNAISVSNESHKRFVYESCTRDLPFGARVLMIGLAFKVGSDDLRESPNVELARQLIEAGFALSIYDPAIEPQRLTGKNVGYAQAHLPMMAAALVTLDQIAAANYDLVIDTFGSAKTLPIGQARIVDVSSLP